MNGDDLPKRAVVIMFESMDKAKEWDSAEDVKAARAIDRGATFRVLHCRGLASAVMQLQSPRSLPMRCIPQGEFGSRARPTAGSAGGGGGYAAAVHA